MDGGFDSARSKWGALLFELVRHAGESGVELAAEGGHGADCRDRDEDGDERILDRSCAGLSPSSSSNDEARRAWSTERAPGDRDRYEPILLELVRYRRERAGQLGAEGGHRRDSRHGDQSRNEAVLDRGGARLVARGYAAAPRRETAEHTDLGRRGMVAGSVAAASAVVMPFRAFGSGGGTGDDAAVEALYLDWREVVAEHRNASRAYHAASHGADGGVLRNERRTSCAHSPPALGAR
jgi:hypothetical protein